MNTVVHGQAVLIPRSPINPLPMGGRVMSPVNEYRWWINVCIVGQHLPQQYRPEELDQLDAATAAAHGLCPTCLGYGSAGDVDVLADAGQLHDPCPQCGGSGRPALRITTEHADGGVRGSIQSLEHEPVVHENSICLACGMDVADGAHHP